MDICSWVADNKVGRTWCGDGVRTRVPHNTTQGFAGWGFGLEDRVFFLVGGVVVLPC